MEEKVLIKSEQYNVKKVFRIMAIIGIILSVLMFAVIASSYMSDDDDYYARYLEHQEDGDCGSWYDSWEQCWACEDIEEHPTKLGYAIAQVFEFEYIFCLIPVAALTLIGGIVYLCLSGFELTVTDKRIFGSVHKKRVDLPLDSVSAISMGGSKSIAVATSSGRIKFAAIKNRDEIHKVVSDLLVERQGKSAAPAPAKAETSVADELKKFKELLDSGIITQEEFDAKKKQLLGL